MAATLSDPCSCCVMPIDHTRIARARGRVHAGKALHVGARRSRLPFEVGEGLALELLQHLVEAFGVLAHELVGRSRRSANSTFITPLRNATSPPVFTPKNSSVIFVPNIALSTLLGTQ